MTSKWLFKNGAPVKCRSGIALCAVVVGLSGLTLCQPPRPRIAGVEVPPFTAVNNAETKDILTASRQAEWVIEVRHPDGWLTHDLSHHR
ncbi:MAG: hypothetical protein HZB34_12155 [Nitrospirae bacterium]|nr:hypothetical protein [Nitrospirota bacterium]